MSGPPEPWLALMLILLLIFCPFEKRWRRSVENGKCTTFLRDK